MTNEEALIKVKELYLILAGALTSDEIRPLGMAIEALEKQEKVKEKYHNFGGYDLEKCMKYGNESEEQRHDSYSTMMMYEIALEFEDLID